MFQSDFSVLPTHQSFDPMQTTVQAFGQQVVPHALGAIGSIAADEACPHFDQEHIIGSTALAAWPLQPSIERTTRDTERSAHPIRRPDPPVLRFAQFGTVIGLSASMYLAGLVLRMRRSATEQSCASSPVSRMAIKRPLASASACIFVLRPARERPTACFCSPLFWPLPSGALLHAWSRSSAHLRPASSRNSFSQMPRRAQRAKRLLDRRRRAIRRRAITPAAAAFEHMHDATDHAPIVCSLLAPHIRRQMRLDPGPLLVAQPK